MDNVLRPDPIILNPAQTHETGIAKIDTNSMNIGDQYGFAMKRNGKQLVLLVRLADPDSEK